MFVLFYCIEIICYSLALCSINITKDRMCERRHGRRIESFFRHKKTSKIEEQNLLIVPEISEDHV